MIRALGPDDAEDAARLIHAAFAAQGQVTDPPSGALQETPASLAAKIGTGGGFAAIIDGAMAGVVLWVGQPCALYLGRLAVHPGFRGFGIGKALVAAVEAEAARQGLARVVLGARLALLDNRAFFAARGYRETGLETHPGYPAPTSVTMQKPVGAPGPAAVKAPGGDSG